MKVYKPLRGRIEMASYNDVGIDAYKGFPMIEALPDILEVTEAVKKIKFRPKFNPEERNLSAGKRKHCVERLSSFIIPLNKHLEVEEKISIFIRKGYLSRNIINADLTRRLRYAMMHFKDPEIAEMEKDKYNIPSPTSSGLGIIGISGAGKTTGISRILNIYPQIIIHPKYKVKQIVWLKIDCPVSGTIKQLCQNFIREISELTEEFHYSEYKDYKTDELIPMMSSLALQHHLGVLIIDEIQYLHEVKSGGAALMLNFFNTLINTIGVPIVLIGTPKARHLFTKEFRNIKRITDQGSVDWDRLDRRSPDWNTLVTYIWDYQWTINKAERTKEIEDALYYESQGIPDLVIKIFKESQKRIIGTNSEFITSDVIHSVAQDQFQLLQPALSALRSGKKTEMLKYLDIFMSLDPEKLITKKDKQLYAEEYGLAIDEILSEQTHDEQIKEVVNWLMDANVAEEVALVATLATQSNDLISWKQNAFRETLLIKQSDVDISKPSKTKGDNTKQVSVKKPEKPSRKQTGLLKLLVPSPKTKNVHLYTLIKSAGYVQDVRERLSLE